MHEAYSLHPSSKLSVQIESMAAYDNHVILGTRSGQLLMYSVNHNKVNDKVELQLLKFNKSFSKKPIVQIEVVPEENLLFSLSDGMLNVCDISRSHFSLVHSAARTKGANIFCLTVRHSKSPSGDTAIAIMLCVAIKRKLEFFYWKSTTNQLAEFQESVELNEIPKALAWSQDIICVGFKTEYVIYDISGKPKKYDICLTSSSRIMEPCICVLNDGLFGVAKDEYLIAVDPKDFTEKDKEKEKKKKEGHVISPEKLMMPKPSETKKPLKPLTWSHPVLSLAWDEPYAIGLTGNGLEVRSLDQGNGLNKDTLVQTIQDLNKARLIVRSSKGSLFAASFSELWYIQSVDIPKQRQNLLQQKRFQLALALTKISEESEDEKNAKIHQIQTLFAFELFANKHFGEAMQVFIKLKTDPCDVIRLFPDLLPQDGQKGSIPATSHNIEPLEDKDLENGLLALIDYLTEMRLHIQTEIKQSGESKTFGKKTPLLSIIDTTLLKCYLQTNDSLVAPLIRLNHCHLEESEKTLKKHQKFEELIILYQTKGQHRRALELLRTQANVAGSSLFGHERTIQYLQHMGKDHKELMFEFADWVLKKYPEDGLEIFTGDFTEIEQLPRAEILDYLLKSHKQLVIPYLEHIIHVWNEPKPMFHNILIQQYREKAQSLSDKLVDTQEGSENQKKISLENVRAKLLEFLEKSSKYNPETVLTDFPTNSLFEERAIILGRLKKHEKVLAIHIQILGDVDKAAEYCEKYYSEEKDIFAMFIKTLLTPPTSPPYSGVELHPNCLCPDNEVILQLLNKYAKKINPAKVLPYLSDDIPLVRLKTFLEVVLRANLERRRQNQVLKGLLYAEDLQMQEQRMHYEMKNVFISDFTVCPVCKKRFTNQSAFVRYPCGKIVHFSCQERK